MAKVNAKFNILTILHIALFVALISICAWVTIPLVVPFTLQTLGIFLACLFLGGKKALAAVCAYLLAGFCGAPVFSGFLCGLGALFSAQGGFLIGFLIIPLIYLLFEKKIKMKIASLVIGTLVCYVIGTLWFGILCLGEYSFFKVVCICVLPFIIPDAIKLFIANLIYKRIKPR